MTSKAFRDRLSRRAKSAGLTLDASLFDSLEAYVRLLAKWNVKVNLTALPLDDPTDDTFDRLLIEPLAAARLIDDAWTPWIDVGSGGGSPAIPLKLAKPALQLAMIESKARKAAFLREAVRELALARATVESVRFEDFAASPAIQGSAGLVTIRAVRLDRKLGKSVGSVLRVGGRLLAFRESAIAESLEGFSPPTSTVLHTSKTRLAYLAAYERG
jgi:16S rRNA (guanine527-N7)-methyltransferase